MYKTVTQSCHCVRECVALCAIACDDVSRVVSLPYLLFKNTSNM